MAQRGTTRGLGNRLLQTIKEIVRPYYLRWIFFRISPARCPRAFIAWRELPTKPLHSLRQEFFSEESVKPDFVFLPMVDWHGPTQRSQQLARGLSRLSHRCLYLNPHLGREFAHPFPLSEHAVVTEIDERIVELHVHLPLEPVFHHRLLHPAEVARVAGTLATALTKMESHEQVVVVSFPIWSEVARELKARLGSTIVYDCHDLLEGFGNVSQDLVAREGPAMAESDLVLFSADWLMKHHLSKQPQLAVKSVVIRNGVDPADFPLAAAATAGNRPTIGYVGHLSGWFNAEWVKHAAMLRPEWQFVLVGPTAPDFPKSSLMNLDNVKFTGEVPYAAVPKWLETFDVAVIPFRVEPLTLGTNPIKLYEYLATGIPVVSSILPEVERYRESVYFAASAGEFVSQIEHALREAPDPAARLRRREVARTETWDARCGALLDSLQTCSRPLGLWSGRVAH